jgi:SAM-dependent methyltransferase
MVDYALLVAPSTNRVYADAAVGMTVAELAAFEPVLSTAVHAPAPIKLGGVDYVGFSADPLGERDIAYLSNLSSAYALFERVGDLLRPITLTPLAHFDDDLLTIQKYSGKTNEQFTKLLLNVTLLASSHATKMLDKRLVVCDPLCGRGTTLNQALMYGYDAIGIDSDGKDFDLYSAFIRTYCKRKRIKHQADVTPVRKDKRHLGRKLSMSIAGDTTLTVFNAETTSAREFLKGGVADVIVTDLPYGVAHGSRTSDRGLSRSPLALLEAAVPVWSQLLQPGGAIGFSWNTHVASRADAAEVLSANGFKIHEYAGFEHWVDQSITRDIVVARKH